MKSIQAQKLLYTKSDIATMLGVSVGIFRNTTQHLGIELINWKSKTQRFTDGEVHQIIKRIRKRLTDEEIDTLIRQENYNLPEKVAI